MTDTTASGGSVHDSVPLPLGNTRYIRVIKIRSSSTEDTLDCEFSILDIYDGILVGDSGLLRRPPDQTTQTEDQKKVDYQALSYTWGDPSATRDIRLNKTPFRIRSNLWNFLDQAKQRGHTGYLWIDAICIDQTKLEERNHQVGIMGDIYSHAKSVIVWLGDRPAQTVLNLSTILNAESTFTSKALPTWLGGDLGLLRQYTSHVQRFCCLPYWSRAWIVQEYHLARRKEIWYGHLRIEEVDMNHMVRLWDKQRTRRAWGAPATNLLFAEEFSRTPSTGNEESDAMFSTFLGLSRLFARLECADRRDRLYALVPLLSPEERTEIGIFPDYSRSATDLFLDVISRLEDAARSSKKDSNFLLILRCYGRMLRPDLQQQAVQIAILRLRDFLHQEGSGIWFAPLDHHCGDPAESFPILVAGGCPRCSKRPIVLYDIDDRASSDTNILFSKSDWRQWVQALLKSQDSVDRKLGVALLKDREFGLGLVDMDLELGDQDLYDGEATGCSSIVLDKIARMRQLYPAYYRRLF